MAGYDFDDGTGVATTDVTVKDINVTASVYGVGAGLNSLLDSSGNSLAGFLDAEGNSFGTNNQLSFGGARNNFGFRDMGNQNNLLLGFNQNDYMTFTVTPDGGNEMDLSSFTFRTRANNANHSAERWALFSSVDGFSVTNNTNNTAIAIGATTDIATWTGVTNNVVIDLSAAKFQNLTTATEFRLYIYGGNNNSSSATMFDKVILNGTVTPIPEPLSAVLLGVGLGTLALRRRRA